MKKAISILIGLFVIIAMSVVTAQADTETTEKTKVYKASLNEILDSLCDNKEVKINNRLSLPAFNVTIPQESTYQLTTELDNFSLLVLLKQIDSQKTLVSIKSQVKPEYTTETSYIPKRTWVKGHYRKGTYVKGYRRKDGTYVKGHSRKGGWVNGYWRTTGTEAVTKTIKKYPYGIDSEILNNAVYTILDSKYEIEELSKEMNGEQIKRLREERIELEEKIIEINKMINEIDQELEGFCKQRDELMIRKK